MVPLGKVGGCSQISVQFGAVPFHVRSSVQTRTLGSVGPKPSLQ